MIPLQSRSLPGKGKPPFAGLACLYHPPHIPVARIQKLCSYYSGHSRSTAPSAFGYPGGKETLYRGGYSNTIPAIIFEMTIPLTFPIRGRRARGNGCFWLGHAAIP